MSERPEQLLRLIADADAHRGGLRCRRVLAVDEDFFTEVSDDVLRLCTAETASRPRDSNHVTHWAGPYGEVTQFSLLNVSGRYDDFSSDHNRTVFGKRFRDAARYPALARLIELFPDALNFRVNAMAAGAGLAPHEEHAVFLTEAGTPGVRARLHLPIATNDAAEIVLDGEVHHLEAGCVYFVNHGCVHAARNGGAATRVHLVWDVLLTEQAFELLFGSAPPETPLLQRPSPERQMCSPRRTEKIATVRRTLPDVPPNGPTPVLCAPQ